MLSKFLAKNVKYLHLIVNELKQLLWYVKIFSASQNVKCMCRLSLAPLGLSKGELSE